MATVTREHLTTYFAAEKSGALTLLIIAAVAIGLSIALVFAKSNYRGMAWPLGLLALFEVGIGAYLLVRTDGQLAGLLEQLSRAPLDMARAELARMDVVMRNFAMVKIGELILIGMGAMLTYFAGRNDFMHAAGVGLVLQSSALLVFDLIASRRAEIYVDALRSAG